MKTNHLSRLERPRYRMVSLLFIFFLSHSLYSLVEKKQSLFILPHSSFPCFLPFPFSSISPSLPPSPLLLDIYYLFTILSSCLILPPPPPPHPPFFFICNTLFSDDNDVDLDLERALKEIEQLKTDREVAIEKRDKQVKINKLIWVN